MANAPARRPLSLRLRSHDYSAPGAYFVTVCVNDRLCLFGEVADGAVRLNAFGVIAHDEWFNTAIIRPYVQLNADEFLVMPDHIHGIIHIEPDVGAQRRCAPTTAPPSVRDVTPCSLGAIVRAFKSITTRRIKALRRTPGDAVWQRNYHDRVVRDEDELNRILLYISGNPARWADRSRRSSQLTDRRGLAS